MGFTAIPDQGRTREANLEFLQRMHLAGATLEKDDLRLLEKHEYLTAKEIRIALERPDEERFAAAVDRYILSPEIYLARCIAAGYEKKWKGKEIKRSDWKCEDPAEFDKDFQSLILSHYIRFCDLEANEKFYLYKKQADDWLAEPEVQPRDNYERKAFRKRETKRFKQNLYYAIEKFGWYKESSLPGGEGKFKCNMAHIFMLYLFDDGRSAYIGKGRQMASTTLFMLVAAFRMGANRNFHCKLIACDLDTTEEIFEDKFKYAYGRLPKWFKAEAVNDSGKLYRIAFDKDAEKGSRKALTSKLSIVAPKSSAINGGAPDMVFVDEAVFLEYFNEMVKEGRPTLFATNAKGKLSLLRQLFAWGTGGRSAKGGGSFEKEHRGLFDKWISGDFSEGIVPVLLDWTCRPNTSIQHYLREQAAYRSGRKDGESQRSMEERDILFRQHYPSSIDDMYSVSGNTLISSNLIIAGERKIWALPQHMQPIYGHFLPVYDMTITHPVGSHLSHPVIGSKWVPMGDDKTEPCVMFMPAEAGWKWRYYQYTDPIMADEGFSKHSSTIWDAHLRTIPCMVNMRTDDPYDSYIQAQLMGMHYAPHDKHFAPHLIENNIGKLLIKYLQGHEWNATKSLVPNFMLPDYLQGGGEQIGIDTHAGRKTDVIRIGKSMLMTHGSNIYIAELWRQLKYFTGKTTSSNNTVWQTSDRRKHGDDVVDSSFGAYVCRLCFQGRMPIRVDEEKEKLKRQAPVVRRVWNNDTKTVGFARVSNQRRTVL